QPLAKGTCVPLCWQRRNDPQMAIFSIILILTCCCFRDSVTLLMIHVLLAVLLLVAVLGVLLSPRAGEVTRGQESMGFLQAVYGVTTIAYALIVQVADA